VGFAAEWGKCGSYYGEDTEWTGIGECKLSSMESFAPSDPLTIFKRSNILGASLTYIFETSLHNLSNPRHQPKPPRPQRPLQQPNPPNQI
jgi:hypothetical protein